MWASWKLEPMNLQLCACHMPASVSSVDIQPRNLMKPSTSLRKILHPQNYQPYNYTSVQCTYECQTLLPSVLSGWIPICACDPKRPQSDIPRALILQRERWPRSGGTAEHPQGLLHLRPGGGLLSGQPFHHRTATHEGTTWGYNLWRACTALQNYIACFNNTLCIIVISHIYMYLTAQPVLGSNSGHA